MEKVSDKEKLGLIKDFKKAIEWYDIPEKMIKNIDRDILALENKLGINSRDHKNKP